jgi:site-specific DNA recombinase
VRHLLSGVAECGVCGARCDRQINNGIPSYMCAGLPPRPGEKRPRRRHVSRTQAPVDALVTLAVVRRLEEPGLLARIVQAQEQRDDEAAGVEREIADLDAQMAEFVLSAQQASGIAAAAFAEVIAGLAARREAAQQRLMETGVVPSAVLDVAGPDAADRWDELPVERRRQVVRALLRVVIHRVSRRGARGFDASTVELLWR